MFVVLLSLSLLSVAVILLVNHDDVGGEKTRNTTLYVGPDESYKTIGSALEDANSGDTIRVFSGIYHEALTISKSVTIQGNHSKDTIINDTTSSPLWWITANDVTIINLGFQGNISLDSYALSSNGMNTTGGHRITLEKCGFTNISGIHTRYTDGHKILDNNISHGRCGALNTARNSLFRNNRGKFGGGIYLEDGVGNIIQNCSIGSFGKNGAETGIGVDGTQNLVQNCEISNLDGPGLSVYGDDNRIEGNIIDSNKWNGLILYCSDRVEIINNTFRNNLLNGIRVIGSDNCSIRYNNFINSEEYGILIEFSAWNTADNEILFNNFIGNGGDTHQAYDYYDGNVWNSSKGGNYWSDHSNRDYNKDGFADASYLIDGEGGVRDKLPFSYELQFPNPVRIITGDVTTINRAQHYSVKYNAYDWDSKIINWTMETNASFLSFSNQVLEGTPMVSTSTYWVNISVRDEFSLDFSNFTLKVMDNRPDVRIITQNVDMCYEDQTYSVDYDAENGDEYLWEIETGADFLSIDPVTGILSGVPENDDVGFHNILVRVIDQRGIDEILFTLEVINTNDDPKIINEDNTKGREGELYYVEYSAVDLDPTKDELSWHLTTNCSFIEMDPADGILTGMPGETDSGNYEINVTVFDGIGGSDSHTFVLHIEKINNPPIPHKDEWIVEIFEDGKDSSLNIHNMFHDVDKDDLEYYLEEDENISVTISDSGILTLVPSPDWFGNTSLSLTANDGEFKSSCKIYIIVRNVNDPPVSADINIHDNILMENKPQKFSATALDIDEGDVLSYQWFIEGIGIVGNQSDLELNLKRGNFTLILKVTDLSGDETTTSILISVLPVKDTIPENGSDGNTDSLIFFFIGIASFLLILIVMVSIVIYRKRSRNLVKKVAIRNWEVNFQEEDLHTLVSDVLDEKRKNPSMDSLSERLEQSFEQGEISHEIYDDIRKSLYEIDQKMRI